MLEIMRRELNALTGARRMALTIAIVPALLYTMLIGNIYRSGVVENIPVVVADLDNSAASRKVVTALGDTDRLRLVGSYSDEVVAEEEVAARRAELALVIPPDYSERLTRGEAVSLHYVVDGTNVLHSSYAASSMQLLAGTLAAEQRATNHIRSGAPYLPPNPLSLSVRVTQNQAQSYAELYLYGIVLTAVQFGLMLGFSGSIFAARREMGGGALALLREWLGRELVYFLLALISLTLGFMAINLVWEMPLRLPLLPTFALYGTFVFCVLNLAGLVALCMRTELRLMQALVFYTLPAFLLSGYVWPVQGMAQPVQYLSALIPLHYITPLVRSLALSGHAANLTANTLVLLGAGLALLVVNIAITYQRLAEVKNSE